MTALAETPFERREQALLLLLDVIGRLQSAGAISVARICTTCRYFRPEAHDDPAAPHHCALLDAPLRRTQLRVDCGDHALAA